MSESPGLTDSSVQRVDGFMYSHADPWLNPYTFVNLSQGGTIANSLWFPRHRCTELFARSTITQKAVASLAKGLIFFRKSNESYPGLSTDELEAFGCRGWDDYLYWPKRAVSDFLGLLRAVGASSTFHEVAIPSAETLLATTYGEHHLKCFGQAGFGNKSLALPWEKTHEDRAGSVGRLGINMTHFSCGHRWQLQNRAHVTIFLRKILKLPACERIRSCPNEKLDSAQAAPDAERGGGDVTSHKAPSSAPIIEGFSRERHSQQTRNTSSLRPEP